MRVHCAAVSGVPAYAGLYYSGQTSFLSKAESDSLKAVIIPPSPCSASLKMVQHIRVGMYRLFGAIRFSWITLPSRLGLWVLFTWLTVWV